MKRIYIAAPFFNQAQLDLVYMAEEACAAYKGRLEFYSPRMDGVLKDMTHEQRMAALRPTFMRNVEELNCADALLALLDHKDSGTTWELGYAYGCARTYSYGATIQGRMRIMAYKGNSEPVNVMLGQCIDNVANTPAELMAMLDAYANDCLPVQGSRMGDV